MTRWRKSSHSGGTGGDCVELAHAPTGVRVRDSKNPDTPPLRFTTAAFEAFLHSLRKS